MGCLVIIFVLACFLAALGPHEVECRNGLPSQWKLFKFGDQTNPLYLDDNVTEFFGLCHTIKGEPAVNCSEVDQNRKCINDCTELRLSALAFAKEKVNGMLDSLKNPWRKGFIWGILSVCALSGIFLVTVGHFSWTNLPLFGNRLTDDATGGIKFRHYIWMKWMVLGDSSSKWHKNLKKDEVIFDWIPLCKQPWTIPATPEDEKLARESIKQEWSIETILAKKGLTISDLEATHELSSVTKITNSAKESAVYQQVLEEYWHRLSNASTPHKRMPQNTKKPKGEH